MSGFAKHDNQSMTYKSALKTLGQTLRLNWTIDKSQVGLYALGAVFEIAGTLVTTYAGARLISLLFTAIQSPEQRSSVWIWLALTVTSQLFVNLGFWLMNYSKRILYILASKWASLTFMKQLSTVDIQSFYDTDSRNRINKLESGYGWMISAVSNHALDFVYGCIRALAIIAVIATAAWWVAPFLLLFLIPSLVAESKSAKAGWFVWDEKGDERHVYWGISYLMTRAKSQLEIRSLQARKYLLGVMDQMLTKFQLKQRSILKNANKVIGPSKLFEVIGIALTEVWLLVRLLYRHDLAISSYIFYSGVITRVNGALQTVVGSYTSMQESLLYARDFFEFANMKPTIDPNTAGVRLAARKIPKIEFQNVSFRYPGTDKWIFEDFSLTIKPGEHIAVIGENGAGKTTFVKLLLRFYDLDKGTIKIDGKDLKSLSLSSWYKQLGTLFQQFNEYPLDIEHNITIGKDGKLHEDRLKQVLTDSGVNQIVDGLPYGLETVLDSSFKKGVEPSGGQWQRVALARAFYRNANILILDEPTAAIDAKAEYEIFNKLFVNQADKTTIIISHRFSTVRRADRIVVLDKGQIVEQGSHEQLMKHSDGLYKEMFEKQAEGYR